MKLDNILLFFGITLPVSVTMRYFQLNFTVETKTGFFTNESGNYGVLLLGLIFVIFIANMAFGYLTYNKPEHPPKGNILLSISAVLLSITLGYQLLTQTAHAVIWQKGILYVSGIITVIYLLLYAATPFVKFKPAPALSTIPTIYLAARLICDFTAISKLALISDNIILILSYCVLLLFFLNFAKLYNYTDTDKNFKKILSFGLASVTLCFTNSIPYFLINLKTNFAYHHTSVSENLTVLFFGVFILTFLLSHF